MRLTGSVRAGLGVALCVLLAATCSAQETNNATKTNVTSTASPNPRNDSAVSTTPTGKNDTTTAPVVPTNATTPNKTVTVTTTTLRNVTTALPVNKTTTTTASEKPTSANVTSANVTSAAATTTSATMTTGSTASAAIKNKGFDLGSFIGGIVLTLSLLAVAYFGCRFYSTRRGVRYRTIDEHEAII